jgi:hypothetical protein
MTVSAKRFLYLFSFVSNFEQPWHDETLRSYSDEWGVQ